MSQSQFDFRDTLNHCSKLIIAPCNNCYHLFLLLPYLCNVPNVNSMKSEFETGRKANLAELIEYSSEAIVSKTLIRKDSGTVTLFAFDQGQGLSEHTAPFDAMVQIVDGEGVIIIDKKEYSLSQGEFIIMPGNVPHAVDARVKFKMLLTMIKSK